MRAIQRRILGIGSPSMGGGLPPLPSGFVFVVDSAGNYLVDDDGAYIITEA